MVMVLLVATLAPASRSSFGDSEENAPRNPAPKALEAEGITEPSLVTTVGSKSGGIVEKVHVKDGDPVKAGATLVTLESQSESLTAEMSRLKAQDESQIRNAELVRDYRKAEFDATDALFKKKVASEQDRRKALAQYQIAVLDVEVAKLQQKHARLTYQRDKAILDAMTLLAPNDGFVTERLVDPGEGIQPLQPVVEITTLDPLYVVVNLSDDALGRVKKGAQVAVIIQQLGNQRLEGRVIFVSPVVDYASKTFKIKISLPNPELKIPAGLKARAVFGNKAKHAPEAPPPTAAD